MLTDNRPGMSDCRNYCSREVPHGWLEGVHIWSLVHSNQPVESKRVTY